MKHKIFMLLTIVGCLGFFSASRQPGRNCYSNCRPIKPVEPNKKPAGEAGFDLSPLHHFIFNI